MAYYFPDINPVAFALGPLKIHWYALAYIVGLFAGVKYAVYLTEKLENKGFPSGLNRENLDDLLVYVTVGVIFGGRLGYVFFYKPDYYLNAPFEIIKLWQGGMSFHGGLLGVAAAAIAFAKIKKIPLLRIADVIAVAAPIGLFFGRIANFLNAELYGRITDVPWAVRFPSPYELGGYTLPRHPSQIYEAFSEGAVLFVILYFLSKKRFVNERPGFIAGVFLVLYATARILCEMFREPDDFLGFVSQIGSIGLTQGMVLSVPPGLFGLKLIFYSYKNIDQRAISR